MAEPPSTKRRDVLNWLVGIWGGGVFASVLYPVLRFLAPPGVPEATSLTVSAGKASSLLPAVCTHLSCTVQYRDDQQQIWCACHNGQYDLNGRNVAGPPPRPLKAYDVNVKGDEIIVSRQS